MSEQHRGPRVPQVNLFDQPSRGLGIPIPTRWVELVLVAVVALVWGGVGVMIALLFGWHPPGGVGP
jgi:hypothetical protein